MMGLDPLLKLGGVCKTTPPPAESVILSDVSLEIFAGEYVAIVGPSGSGKSTLLNMLGLLDRPSSGTYLFKGTNTQSLSESSRAAVRGRSIGFVFQDFRLLSHRNTLENVLLGSTYLGMSTKVRKENAISALARVNMTHKMYQIPSVMSGGERQRTAIARALSHRPQLLLCDEPTGSLDSVNTQGVLELLNQLHQDGVTLVVITHDMEVAANAQRVAYMSDGMLSDAPHEQPA